MLEHLPARAATGGRVPCAVRGLRLVTTPQRNCRRVCAHRRPHWEGPPPDRPEEAFKVFCCDQDSSVLHQLNTDPRAAHVQVVHDPGHTKKNFVKDLKKATIRGRTFANREEQQAVLLAEFKRRMAHARSHYFAPFCGQGCPCYTPSNTTLEFQEHKE